MPLFESQPGARLFDVLRSDEDLKDERLELDGEIDVLQAYGDDASDAAARDLYLERLLDKRKKPWGWFLPVPRA